MAETSVPDEASRIIALVRDFITQEKLNELLLKLDEQVGKGENEVTKHFISILQLSKEVVKKTSATAIDKLSTIPKAPKWLWLAFYALVIAHIAIVLAFITSFFVLPVLAPWYIAVPCMTFIWFFSTTRVDCQLTNLENVMRRRLGLRRIGGFVGHYFLRPAKAIWGRRHK